MVATVSDNGEMFIMNRLNIKIPSIIIVMAMRVKTMVKIVIRHLSGKPII